MKALARTLGTGGLLRTRTLALMIALAGAALGIPGTGMAQPSVTADVHVIAPAKKPDGSYWDTALTVFGKGGARGLLPDIAICVKPATGQRQCSAVCQDSRDCRATFTLPAGTALSVEVFDVDTQNHDLMFRVSVRDPGACAPCEFPAADGRLTIALQAPPGDEPCPDPGVARQIEDSVRHNAHVSVDFPRNPPAPRWINGVPTVAQANAHLLALEEEFHRIVAKAERSHDAERVYSAAYWFISNSDPALHPIRRTDYTGLQCDIIRNRIVVMLGRNAWQDMKAAVVTGRSLDPRDILTRGLEGALKSIRKYGTRPLSLASDYSDADALIDDLTRPPLYSAERQRVLATVAKRVGRAMDRLGHGSCPYYEEAVHAWDYRAWRHQTLRQEVPVDWQHDFIASAVDCLSGK